VTDVLVEDGEIVGVEIEHETGPGKRVHREPGTTEEIRARHVVNATGAWAGNVGEMAGVDVEVRPEGRDDGDEHPAGRHRHQPLSTEGRRRHHRPHETACILGTTDEEVDDPEDYPEEEGSTS